MATIDYKSGLFLGIGTFEERKLWEKAGFTYSRVRKAWITDLAEVAERVAEAKWTQAALDHQGGLQWVAKTAREMSYADTTDFQPPVPGGLHPRTGKPFEYLGYQRAGIEYALERADTLIGDAPGLGKTIQGIGFSNCLADDKRRVLIIAPASLKVNWSREWGLWDTKGLSVGIAETQHQIRVPDGVFKTGKKAGQPKFRIAETIPDFWPDTEVVIVNPDILDRFEQQIKSVKWDILIVDEAHSLKSADSNRTLFILGGRRKEKVEGQRAKSWVNYLPIAATRRLFLSGTPLLNRPVEIWPLCKACDPKGLGLNYEKFVYRYCGAWWNPMRGKFGALDVSGASNKEELGQKLRESFMIRRIKSEVLKDLPDKSRHIILLDSPELREAAARENEIAIKLRMYETEILGNDEEIAESVVRMAAEYGFDETDPSPKAKELKLEYAAGVLGLSVPEVAVLFHEMAEARRELGLAKLSAVVPWVKDFLNGGEKLVLFGYHTDVIKALVEALVEYNPACIYGGTQVNKRQLQVDKFQTDESCRVIILNIDAGGVGHTLTRASDVAFAEGDWTPAKLLQGEDRVHRIGQLALKIMIFYLVANGSLDAKIAQSSKMKEDNIAAILDS